MWFVWLVAVAGIIHLVETFITYRYKPNHIPEDFSTDTQRLLVDKSLKKQIETMAKDSEMTVNDWLKDQLNIPL